MIKILIVDDEDMMRELAKPFFERRGFVVHYASSGKEGFEVFGKEKPDVVLLDLGLPDIEGREVFARMRELDKTPKIIILTGFGEEEIKNKVLPLGPDAYFTKPCKLAQVAERIQSLCRI